MVAQASDRDTIAAPATPPGRGGIGVIRVSGSRSAEIAKAVCGNLPKPRCAAYREFRDAEGNSIDAGLLLWFPGPNSFTGEDVIEFQGHGGPVVMDMLLARILECGARPARPGEFSERAFLNDRLDLAQAEAIADLIDAGSREAATAAMRSLQGAFSEQVNSLVEQVIHLRLHVEAAIDFPDEDVDFLADAAITRQLDNIAASFSVLEKAAGQGRLLRDGLTVVLAGRPNAGKSSLLNLLAGQDAAIVTDIPGTTRDILREYLQVDGMPLHVLDTAGLREDPDAIEGEGIRRARDAMRQADAILLVTDDTNDDIPRHELPQDIPVITVRNKIDLSGRKAGRVNDREVALCATSGDGLDALHAEIKALVGHQVSGSGDFSARRRHVESLQRARHHVEQGRAALEGASAGELLAEELRLAQQHLNEITGEFTADDLLGRIFSSFCIGK
jgi:tRNA modification GTPase